MASLSKIIDVHSHAILAFGEAAPVGDCNKAEVRPGKLLQLPDGHSDAVGRGHLGPEPLLLPEQTKVTPLLFSVLRAILPDARKSQTLGPALLRIRADSTPASSAVDLVSEHLKSPYIASRRQSGERYKIADRLANPPPRALTDIEERAP
jgi:hypothetical protein